MRILSLTAGAASMYCGTCLRDNALARRLIAQGHTVLLVPLYTPTLTDEENVSQPRIFFGGVSVYLKQHLALFRHLPPWVDRLWDSPSLLRAVSRRSIPVDPRALGEITISVLEGPDGPLRKEVDKLLGWLRREPSFDVIDLPYSLLIGLARPLKQALQAPVCCTLQGEDLFLNGLMEPYRTRALQLIRSQVPAVDRFIAVSDYYRSFMSRFLDIPADRMDVVRLGINLEGFERAPQRADGIFRIGYLARVAPEKGLHLLAEAFIGLQQRMAGQVRLEAAGYLAPEHRRYLRQVEDKLAAAGLTQAFRYHGVLDRRAKIAFLRTLDVLSVPAAYDEPKGLSVLEAMGCGVPVVVPSRGSLPEIIERTGGGLLVRPNDPADLAAAFQRLYEDSALRRRLADRAWDGVREHYDIHRMASETLAAYERARAAKPVEVL